MLNIRGLDKKCPNLTLLDLSYNEIFKIETIEILTNFQELSELNLEHNPICIHKDLLKDLEEGIPFLEVFNKKELVEAGSKYKDKAVELKVKLTELRDKVVDIRSRDTIKHLQE